MKNDLKLYSSCRLHHLELKNRAVMAPMTRCRAIDNIPNDLMAKYYSQRTEAGLIITEATAPSANGLGAARIPGIFTQEQIEGWKKITAAVHENDTAIFLQLMHTGRVSHKINMPKSGNSAARILAPSAIAAPGTIWTDSGGALPLPVPEAMSLADIEQTKIEFATAARNAMEAGFDGVELHAANGYLLHEFINPASNHRMDEYGFFGENRFRMILEVLDAVGNAIGREKVGIHLSPFSESNGLELFDGFEVFYLELAEKIGSYGAAYIHLVCPADDLKDENFEFAARMKKSGAIPLIVNNGFDRDSAERILELGYADLVSFARHFLANPDLITRFRRNLELNRPDRKTFYSSDEKGYTDYPGARI